MKTKSWWCAALVAVLCIVVAYRAPAPITTGPNSGGSGSGGPPTGAAGGGLTGTYPNPTLANPLAVNNAGAITNIPLADGGATIVIDGQTVSAWGSSNKMNPTSSRSLIIVNGTAGATGYNNGGDAQVAVINYSTNVTDSGGGIGPAVMGGDDGSGKASIFSSVGGPMLVYEPTNRYEALAPGNGYIVFNSYPAAKAQRGFGLSSPGYPNSASGDAWNFFGFYMDTANGLARFPLINASSAGLNEPASVVYQITISVAVGVAPANWNVTPTIYSNNGVLFTSYTNNLSGGTGPWMVSSSLGAPAASGIFTKIQGTGDATITFSASSVLRSYAGDAFTINPNGNVGAFSNIFATNGTFTTTKTHANTAGSPVPQFAQNPSTVDFDNGALSQNGMTVYVTRGGTILGFGSSSHHNLSMFTSGQGWNTGTSVAVGDDDLDDLQNFGQSTLEVHGSLGTIVTNVAGNKTLGMQDSVVIVKASGVAIITLPDSTSHCKGREYVIVNDGTTNVTLNTTSSQTIGNSVTVTSITLLPGQYIAVNSDGANWKQFGGNVNQPIVIAQHYGGSGTSPTVVTNAGAGSPGATVTLDATASDFSGIVTLVTGTAPATNSNIFTITFNKPYSTQPHFVWSFSGDNNVQGSVTNIPMYVGGTTNAFSFQSQTIALQAATTYRYTYIVSQ